MEKLRNQGAHRINLIPSHIQLIANEPQLQIPAIYHRYKDS
jgi:hypothetical protein